MNLHHLFNPLPWILFIFHINSYQPDPGETILAGLQQWHENNPQEKIFIQTDREKYAAGETVWFKSWCVVDNRPGFLSRIIYITLSDARGKVIDKKMVRLDNLSAACGLLDLSKELKTGSYTLKAYTLWMLNYPQFIFQKNIHIYGNDYKQKTAQTLISKNIFIFFPEGGDMLESVKGQVAFKAVNRSGFPIGFKGAIFSAEGEKIIELQELHDGMGMTEFEPAPDKMYTAKIVFNDGQTAEYKLPAAKKEGIALQVNSNSPSRISILINRAAYNKEKYKKVFVVAQIGGIPVFKADFNIDDGEAGTSILKKNLPPGIMQITAFDTLGNPLSERLAFINNYKIISPEFKTHLINTGKRGRNLFSFRLDSSATSAISVLVIDASIDPEPYRKENIASSFLLSSDIKGYIHNPGYYFSDKESETGQHLDLLLMTQGWRRFTWKQIKGEEDIVLRYPVETYMTIRGMVLKSGKKEPLKDGFVTLITKTEDSTTILTNAKLTDKGEFIVDSLVFRSSAKILYEGTDNKKTRLPVDVSIYPAYIDTLQQMPLMLHTMPESDQINTENDMLAKHITGILEINDPLHTKMLETVTVKGKVLSKTDSLQKIYVSPVYEMSDLSLLISEKKQYLNIWQFLNETVPGFNVNPFQTGGVSYASFSRYDGISLTDSEQGIKFFINEMPVSIDAVDAINPGDVALVKVYKGTTGFALGAESGAISVYTKKGADSKGAVYDKIYTGMNKIGFAFSREFYAPNYTLHPELNKKEADGRVILYWQPDAKKTSIGDYSVEFHNNDKTTSFKIIIQGIDIKGQLIYKEQLVK